MTIEQFFGLRQVRERYWAAGLFRIAIHLDVLIDELKERS